SGFADTVAGIALRLGGAGGDVAWNEIAETRIAALEVVVTLAFRNGTGGALVAGLLGDPDASVVAKRFGHESELGLILTGDGDAGGMNLGEARIGEESAALVGAPDGGGVATLGVGGKVEDVAVAAGGEDYGVGDVDFDFAVVERASDDAAGLAVNDD